VTGQRSSGWMVGFTAFAAFMMMLIGSFQIAIGVVAVFNQDFYVSTPNYVFAFDVGVWGWIHLLWGIVVLAAGIAVLRGSVWAATLGSVIAAISAVQAFLFLPYEPFWSIIVIALSVMVIWALTTGLPDYVGDPNPDI
jgi:hypothetical protein